ncbi:MAG: hypothetical protein PHP42_07730 [Bacteroidota bacterium]|nr:hypothetical protein [Bacteroidota bacterium]
MLKYLRAVLLLVCFSFVTLAQLKVTSVEKINLPTTEHWTNAIFSHSGKEIYLSNESYNGIWQFSLETKVLKEVARGAQTGYNFSLSEDGSKIAYRRTIGDVSQLSRRQESVIQNLSTQTEEVIESGSSVASPVFINNMPLTMGTVKKSGQTTTPIQQQTIVLGIEDTKILLLQNGDRVTLDPFGNGQYIWPVLSPDKSLLVAVEMERGAFICDVTGKNIQRLGKCNGPSWTRDGKWIVGMDDRDDGHRILSSDIIVVSVDGKQKFTLTENLDAMAMFPHCSSVENKIIFTTDKGEVYMMTYEEVQ